MEDTNIRFELLLICTAKLYKVSLKINMPPQQMEERKCNEGNERSMQVYIYIVLLSIDITYVQLLIWFLLNEVSPLHMH